MRNGGRFLAFLVLASSLLAQPLAAQTVTNVRAKQLSDKSVEVLYDLSGAASAGATVTVAFSSDGGGTYAITPSVGALSGHVGTGIASGTNRRIVWNAAASLPAQTYGTNYRAAVTAKQTPQTGELSFKLAWQSCADLDLYVKDPAGYEIYYKAKTSPSGGELDVDANADCDECVQGPIENVYWRTGSAPTGRYESWVKLYSTCSVAPPIAYVLTIMRGGAVVQTHSGTLSTAGQTSAIFSYNVESGGSSGQEVTYTLPGGVPLVMVRVPAGTFQMGSPSSERNTYVNEQPVHSVALTSDYYIGKYEVTQAQWQAVMGSNPSYFSSCGESCPVELVSWDDIRGGSGFIVKLNQLLGTTKFRLPTEAEWERAARGGTQTRFSFGDALDGSDECGANAAANSYVWWCGNAERTTHPVGTKTGNPYGLFDMHGNVMEWVEDWVGTYSAGAQTNPTGPATGSNRRYRSGAWNLTLGGARSASRGGGTPGSRSEILGFRLAGTL